MAINKNSLEKEETQSPFHTGMYKDSYTVSEFVEEFIQPCGRFTSPLSLEEKLELKITQFISRLNVFRSMTIVPKHTVSLNWQVLLNYLYTKKIIAKPEFIIGNQAHDLPRRYTAFLRSSPEKEITDGERTKNNITGYSAASTQEEAYSKAIGELLERYFLSVYKADNFIHSSYTSLVRKNKNVLELEQLNTYLPWQKDIFPELNFNVGSLLSWVKATQINSGTETYIPSQLIFWNYNFENAPLEPTLVHSTSNGGAGHFSLHEAILSGIHEVVERDSFLLFWLNSISPPILNIKTLPGTELHNIIEKAHRYGLKVYFLDTTSDVCIPACVCVVLDERGDDPRISIGGGAGFNLADTLTASLYEALSIHNKEADNKVILDKNFIPFTTKINREDRLRLWRGQEMLKRFNFFINGTEVPLEKSRFWQACKNFESTKQEYDYTLHLFQQLGKGYEIYCYQVKNKILKQLGYYVVKIVIPQLVPLYLREHLATLNSKRLREVPHKLGYNETTLNPWPHPFP